MGVEHYGVHRFIRHHENNPSICDWWQGAIQDRIPYIYQPIQPDRIYIAIHQRAVEAYSDGSTSVYIINRNLQRTAED